MTGVLKPTEGNVSIFEHDVWKNQILVKEITGNVPEEANVYLAYDMDEKEVAIKIYKIDSNTSRWMRNYIIGDPRFKKIPHNVSKIIFLWASKEFKNLKRARKVGLLVPEPILIKNNILLMEYIGFGPIPAPKLKDIKNPKELEKLSKEILDFINPDFQDYPIICDILESIWNQLNYIANNINYLLSAFEDISIITNIILIFLGFPFGCIALTVYFLGLSFGCECPPPNPQPNLFPL